jgi:transposase-like protein
MRKSRFSEEQKVKMVWETEQKPVAEVAKKHGTSSPEETAPTAP